MIKENMEDIFTELRQLIAFIQPDNLEQFVAQILKARKIAVLGAGRSALALKMVAMRLRHLGLDAYVAGETISPCLGPKDLLIVASGSGNTASICHIADRAHTAGATVWALTGSPESKLANIADSLTLLPTRDNSNSSQFGGTLFETCVLILGDALVPELLEHTGQSHADMLARHTNLE